jgi:hypothetical protein
LQPEAELVVLRLQTQADTVLLVRMGCNNFTFNGNGANRARKHRAKISVLPNFFFISKFLRDL